MAKCPSCTEQAGIGNDKCDLLMSAYILAGLAMMLNIRLAYSSAPYALIRFKLPENLFSVFVRRMASALELWCLPSMLMGNIMDLFQKLFDGGAELRAIMKKADDIKSTAETLKTTAQSAASSVDVKGAAGTLATNAGTLNGATNTLALEGTLADLSGLATDLATAAKGSGGSDDTSLHAKATQLQGAQTDPTEAKAVIAAFNNVKNAYEKLEEHQKYQDLKKAAQSTPLLDSGTPAGKVQSVDRAWTQVNNDFENLCKALFKYYAEQVETQANALQGNPSVEKAKQFKEAYDNFGKVYNAIPDGTTAKTTVQSEWNALKDVISGEMKRWKFYWIIVPSIITQWLIFLTYVLLLIIFFTVLISLEKILSQMPNRCLPTIYKIDYPCSTIKIQ